jgi:SPP1 family phage portal protein
MRNRRRRERHLADNRAAHDFASYIADFINGYCFGHAVQVQTDDESTQEKINGLHNLNDIDTHNRSIGLDLSIFGRAYEYIIRNQDEPVSHCNQTILFNRIIVNHKCMTWIRFV